MWWPMEPMQHLTLLKCFNGGGCCSGNCIRYCLVPRGAPCVRACSCVVRDTTSIVLWLDGWRCARPPAVNGPRAAATADRTKHRRRVGARWMLRCPLCSTLARKSPVEKKYGGSHPPSTDRPASLGDHTSQAHTVIIRRTPDVSRAISKRTDTAYM